MNFPYTTIQVRATIAFNPESDTLSLPYTKGEAS